jgi:hypothetical protein
MSHSPQSWQSVAKEVYRLAATELLDRWLGKPRSDEVDYFVEELREALLDLKVSTIEDREHDALKYLAEVSQLLAELRLRPPDEPG